MGVSIPAAIKARPIAGRASQRRQHTLLAISIMVFLGMFMIRGDLIMNLRIMFPTALEANAMPAPIESPQKLAPIVMPAAAAPPPPVVKKEIEKSPAQLPKVALLFLTRGPMPLESIWRDFLGVDPINPSQNKAKNTITAAWQKYFSLYVHPAPGFTYSEESIFAPYTVDSPVLAEWGKHSIVDAEKKLLQAALEDPLNSYFVLLSETHIPLYSAAATYLQLATAKHSRVHACGNSSDEEDANRRMTYRMSYEMKDSGSGISEDTWRKSSQWFGLIRSHAHLVAEERKVNAAFDQYCYVETSADVEGEFTRFCVSDEHYIPTMLSINEKEKECACDGHITRVVWTGNYMHPKSYGKVEATMDTLRHELRGEIECRHGRVLERVADKVLEKIEKFRLMAGEDGAAATSGVDEGEDIGDLNGEELVNYVLKSSKAVVMKESCPLFARKIEKEAEVEWRTLLKTVLTPVI